jgi:hypothetical protein
LTGSLTETHALVTYSALGMSQGIDISYDSLRANPIDIYYFALSALPKDTTGMTLIVRLTLRNVQGVSVMADGMAPADAEKLGLSGGEFFFALPDRIPDGSTYGAGIPIDLSKVGTGLYTMVLEYGVFKKDSEGKYTEGRFFTYTQPYAVVNRTSDVTDPTSVDDMFGAGWGVNGIYELYSGDAGVLLVDGSGHEEIFLAPSNVGDDFTALSSCDYSALYQRTDGTFVLQSKEGVQIEFNKDGKMAVRRDPNGNETTSRSPTRSVWSRNSNTPAVASPRSSIQPDG